MQNMHNVHVLRVLVMEREASLRRILVASGDRSDRRLRRWIGRRLVALGAWVGAEQAAQPAWA